MSMQFKSPLTHRVDDYFSLKYSLYTLTDFGGAINELQ